jgi:hypothetical protein
MSENLLELRAVVFGVMRKLRGKQLAHERCVGLYLVGVHLACGQARLTLPLEQENERYCCERCGNLERQYDQRLSWRSRQPLDRKERHDRRLRHDLQLEDTGGCTFIGVADDAEPGNVIDHQGEGCERHRQWQKGAGTLEQG